MIRKTTMLFILTCIISFQMFAQSEKVILRGEIYDSESEELVQNVLITIVDDLDSLNADGSYHEYLAENGTFSFELERGEYTLSFYVEGYSGYREKIILTEETDLRIAMQKIVTYENLISGSVKNENNETVAYASLHLMGLSGNYSYWNSTDEEGNFTFTNIAPGTYILNIESNENKPYRSDEIVVDENTQLDNMEFILTLYQQFTNFQIYVYANENEIEIPLEECEIWLYTRYLRDPMGIVDTIYNGRLYGVTDAEGKISFAQIMEGNYYFDIRKKGYQLPYYFAEPVINVFEDNQVYPIEMMKIPEPISGTIKGRVFHENTGDPLLAMVEFIRLSPVFSDSLNFPEEPWWGFTRSYSTETDGSYEVKLDTGSYKVKATYYPYDRYNPEGIPAGIDFFFPFSVSEYYDNAATYDDAQIIRVSENGIVENINIGLDFEEPDQRLITITGKIEDNSGNALEGAFVDAHINAEYFNYGMRSRSSVTDAGGNYTVELKMYSSTFCEIKLSAYKEGYEQVFYNGKPVWHQADPILISNSGEDTTITDINFSLKQLDLESRYTVSGLVTDTLGNGLANIYVEASGINNRYYAFGVTDSLGNYEINDLIEGKYVVSFFGEKYRYEFYDDTVLWEDAQIIDVVSDIFNINAALTGFEYDFYIMEPGRAGQACSGEVVDADGNPIAGAFVNVMNAEGEIVFSTTTNSNGEFRINNLQNADYTLTISKVEYESITENISFNESNNSFNFIIRRSLTDVEEEELVPAEYKLSDNYPNPFNPSTKIKFWIPENGFVSLKVFNVLGQEVSSIVNDELTAGSYEINFNATDLTSGIYFYRLQADGFVQIKKMMLLK